MCYDEIIKCTHHSRFNVDLGPQTCVLQTWMWIGSAHIRVTDLLHSNLQLFMDVELLLIIAIHISYHFFFCRTAVCY